MCSSPLHRCIIQWNYISLPSTLAVNTCHSKSSISHTFVQLSSCFRATLSVQTECPPSNTSSALTKPKLQPRTEPQTSVTSSAATRSASQFLPFSSKWSLKCYARPFARPVLVFLPSLTLLRSCAVSGRIISSLSKQLQTNWPASHSLSHSIYSRYWRLLGHL